jgi:bifunctional DNA-binding transcriptional regulator/antitoxin component of YhaV-PrlF toxin-antitoxin module
MQAGIWVDVIWLASLREEFFLQHPAKSPNLMPKVRLAYDGWLALPVTVRQKLGLSTGDHLEVELKGGTIVLHPVGKVAANEEVPSESPASSPLPSAVSATAPKKRGPGRPRKTPTPNGSATKPGLAVLPPGMKTRGRRAAVSKP